MDKSRAELEIFKQALGVARKKGGESRRNADKLSLGIKSYDRPDILLRTNKGRIVGIEHFRVDQLIKHDKKKQSEAAKFSSKVELLRKRWKDDVCNGDLPDSALRDLGELFSKSNLLISRACVDDIVESLEAGLFGGNGRGHCAKLENYKNHISASFGGGAAEIGLLIEFHTNLVNWFFNDGSMTRKVRLGEFPLSTEAYDLLEKASAKIDWLILAFCPLYDRTVVDSVIVDCRNGKFGLSMRRQRKTGLQYLGLGKTKPCGAQGRQGNVGFRREKDVVHYCIENASDPIDAMALLADSIENAAKAINLRQSGQPFLASFPVQLTYCLVSGSVRRCNCDVYAYDVDRALRSLTDSSKRMLTETFKRRWEIGYD